MYCCKECFKDVHIRSFITNKNKIGKCSYCESDHVHISDIEVVGVFIKKCLLKKYQVLDSEFFWHIDEQNSDLVYLLTETAKTRLFQEDIFSNSNDESLLNDLFEYSAPDYRDISKGDEDLWENGEVNLVHIDASQDYPYSSSVMSWAEFKMTVKHNNRFFDLGDISREVLLEDIKNTITKMTIKLPANSLVHRARLDPGYRIKSDINSFLKECGPPPVVLSKPLRMNPVGISYFYCSNDEKTCLAEVRAGFNDKYIMGSFKTRKELKLLDLTIEPETKIPSIFSEEYSQDIYLNMMFFRDFSSEISRPVTDMEAPIEYLSTQLLSEYLRKQGFEGICYKSSLTGEKNYTLFCGPDHESYLVDPPFSQTIRNYVPIEFTDWLYLVEFKQGIINDIGYETWTPQIFNIEENPLPYSEREKEDFPF